MPFPTEKKSLKEAREAAAAAGYKSMGEATGAARSRAKADGMIASEAVQNTDPKNTKRVKEVNNFIQQNEREWRKGDTYLEAENNPPRRAQD